MFNFFKKSEQSVTEVIEEIHETFYSEVDKLLAEAKIKNSLESDKQHLIDKSKRLKDLGFTNTKEIRETEDEIRRLDGLKSDNEDKIKLIEAIEYFSFKYPNYKFITEDSVKKICSKYNLVYGGIDRYLGEVPDKNLKHIEDFKISKEDECFIIEVTVNNSFGGRPFVISKGYAQSKEITQSLYSQVVEKKCPLEIAAPMKDFDMTNMEIKDHNISQIEVPDPVVLKPVVFKNKKYYLIVTAWGVESTDNLVINPKNN